MARTHIGTALFTPLDANLAAGGNKITGLANGTAATDAAAFGQLKVIQTVFATGTTSTTTTSTSPVATVVTATITPTSASSRIFIIANGIFNIATPGTINLVGVMRGSTELTGGTTLGNNVSRIIGSAATAVNATASVNWVDSPATTSATAYSMSLANFTGNSVTMGGASLGSWSITLMEVV